jgi:hypothetical protein
MDARKVDFSQTRTLRFLDCLEGKAAPQPRPSPTSTTREATAPRHAIRLSMTDSEIPC